MEEKLRVYSEKDWIGSEDLSSGRAILKSLENYYVLGEAHELF